MHGIFQNTSQIVSSSTISKSKNKKMLNIWLGKERALYISDSHCYSDTAKTVRPDKSDILCAAKIQFDLVLKQIY